MRLKWFGTLALIIDLFLVVAIRNKYGATLTGDSIIVLILVLGLVLIMADCRTDDKKYIESLNNKRKEEQHGKGGDL